MLINMFFFRVFRSLSCTKLYVLYVVDILLSCHIEQSNLWRLFYNGLRNKGNATSRDALMSIPEVV
jgi:hypothetical protein